MTKRIRIALLVTLILALASFALAAEPTSPVIVARFLQRNITASIPTTTVFTPKYTGLYRASVYITVTNLGYDAYWLATWNWNDDAGQEQEYISQTAVMKPPSAYGYAADGINPSLPLTFEAVGGQPVSFTLTEYGIGGACTLAIVVELLE
jgi:hypothetical protein